MITAVDLVKDYSIGKDAPFAGVGSSHGKGVGFSVGDGEIFGVIGPDGAGKSTLFRILASLILPDKGTACLQGYDVVKDYKSIRKIVGYMPGTFSLYQDLTVEENLKFFATVFGASIKENYYLVEDIYKQIEPFKHRLAGALSGGMKQKLALSCALIHKPEILILDEPTTGVDPVSRKEFWDILRRLKQENITVLVSTAYMDEASRCDRIALMQNGMFITTDTPQQIVDNYKKSLWKVKSTNMFHLLKTLREYEFIETAFAFGDQHHITVTDDFTPEYLKGELAKKGFENVEIAPCIPSVEDCFMALSATIE